jgi:hypothetical protein
MERAGNGALFLPRMNCEVMIMKTYRHTQTAPELAVILAALSLALGISGLVLPQLLLIAGLLLYLIWLFHSFTIEIDEGELHWRFGSGWIQQHVRLSDIASACVIRTSVLGGWGIYYSTFGWLYNVSGFNAVAIVLRNGKRICLGSDEPELLAKALATDEHG